MHNWDDTLQTVENLNAHVMYSPLVYSKTCYGLIKIIELSCNFSVIF